SGERRLSRQLLPQDEGVDLVRALVGADGLEVVRVPQRRVVERDAVAAQQRARLAGDRDRLPAVVELADGDLVVLQRPRILQAPQLECQQEALVDLERHVDELALRELERGERTTE